MIHWKKSQNSTDEQINLKWLGRDRTGPGSWIPRSSPEDPDTTRSCTPVPPTTALQESMDIFVYGGGKTQ